MEHDEVLEEVRFGTPSLHDTVFELGSEVLVELVVGLPVLGQYPLEIVLDLLLEVAPDHGELAVVLEHLP